MWSSFSAMSGLARAVELGQDVGVVGQEVVLSEDAEAEALAEGVGELVVDDTPRSGSPTSRGSSSPNSAAASRATDGVGEDDRPVDHRQVREEPRDDLGGSATPQARPSRRK